MISEPMGVFGVSLILRYPSKVLVYLGEATMGKNLVVSLAIGVVKAAYFHEDRCFKGEAGCSNITL